MWRREKGIRRNRRVREGGGGGRERRERYCFILLNKDFWNKDLRKYIVCF